MIIKHHRWLYLLITLIVIYIAGCGDAGSSVSEPNEMTSTSVPTATATPKPTDTPAPTSTSTPTPRVTITPNAPGIVGDIVYAQPPQNKTFSRPAAIVPARLKIVNETDLQLRVTLEGISNSAPVAPGSTTEWEVLPGSYDYAVISQQRDLTIVRDTVAIDAGEIVEIVIDEETIGYVVFANQTGFPLTIEVPATGQSLNLSGGQTSYAIPLAPDAYDFTARAASARPYQGEFTVEGGKEETVTLIAQQVFGDSSVTLNNQTDFSVRLSVNNTGASLTAAAGQRSEPAYLPPGNYTYTACDTASGTNCTTGNFSVEAGENVEVTIDASLISTSAVRFQNQTPYQLSIDIPGVTSGVIVPPGGTSEPIDILPGSHTYRASSTNNEVAPFEGQFSATQGKETTVSLTLSGERASFKVTNGTSCQLRIDLNGPSTFTFYVAAGATKEVNIQNGNYTYTASACNASTNGEFSGSTEVEFYLSEE